MLIIIDETMGQSWSFVATQAGYAAAYARIQTIISQGHRVGGDAAKVMAHMG